VSELVGIGAVIAEFADEFPDLTVSKVRFLESQGLLDPVRTPSGYRRYSPADRERLRYILTTQRDHFLPLKVIAEHLDAMSRGLAPPTIVDPTPQPPPVGATADTTEAPPSPGGPDVRLSEAELLRSSGMSASELAEALGQGLLTVGADGHFGGADLAAATAIAGLADYGLTPRHLRAVRLAADRHLGLVDQVVNAGGLPSDAQRAERATAILDLTRRLEAALLRSSVSRNYPSDR
jgi:DNA-binding transcriptional MerR regulator